MAHLNALGELGQVHVVLEEPQRSRNLAVISGANGPSHRVDLGRGGEGVVRDSDDGHRRASQAPDEPSDRFRWLEPAGQNDGSDVWKGLGTHRCQTGKNDVGPVATGDHHRARPQVRKHVGQLHRGHHELAGKPVQALLVTEHQLPVEGGHDLGHAGVTEHLLLRHQIGGIFAAPFLGEGFLDLCKPVGGNSVDQSCHDGAALPLESPTGSPDVLENLVRLAALAIRHEEHRDTQVSGHTRVEFELERRSNPRIVGPFADHEVALGLQVFVSPQDASEQLIGLIRSGQGARLVVGATARRFSVLLQRVSVPHQADLTIRFRALADHGSEKPEVFHPSRGQLHQAKRRERLASTRLYRCNVDALCHVRLSGAAGCHRVPSLSMRADAFDF